MHIFASFNDPCRPDIVGNFENANTNNLSFLLSGSLLNHSHKIKHFLRKILITDEYVIPLNIF